MACIFCEIGKGAMQAYKIYEDDSNIAFLDIYPAVPGHVVVTPKEHVGANIFDTDELALRRLISAVKHVAEKVHNVLQADINIMQNNGRLAGQGVDHIHFHVIPQVQGRVLPLPHNGPRAPEEDLKAMAEKLKGEGASEPSGGAPGGPSGGFGEGAGFGEGF